MAVFLVLLLFEACKHTKPWLPVTQGHDPEADGNLVSGNSVHCVKCELGSENHSGYEPSAVSKETYTLYGGGEVIGIFFTFTF